MSDGEGLAKTDQSAPIRFGSRLAGSQVFSALFKDGMALVEETAAYLDGPGREASRGLTRAGSLTYATESMRLTTRLMRLASWLLLQRAVNDGELTVEQMAAERAKVKLSGMTGAVPGPGWDALPEQLCDLIDRSSRLQARVCRLDGAIDGEPVVHSDNDNAVRRQIGRIAEAFASK